ncbi:uncharacterized protein LOC111088141 isoform X2 [Limulus polyphemus]|uniref:Uncharacterized protein LOC111088141 isoform X2 n=1 Tax=Limulus polyphemus TaxID=6850 RepID=A0ABM1TAQ9_LIMPO|nr:uncharacterized protein LOC111088141 isoform X2 [Limulus polyphemus]
MCDGMSAFRGLLLLLLLSGFVAFHELEALKITRLSVPRWIENGTLESVTLDCEYSLTDKDNRLVVKWFFNDDPKPIYQWIPELGSRLVSEKLQGRIDMNFSVTPSSKFTEFRNLRILKPTSQLSGKYSCHVASFNGIDTAEGEMTVYAPAKLLRFNYTKTKSDRAKFSCEVGHVYPVPDISVYKISPGESEPTIITDGVAKVSDQDDSYRVLVTYEVKDSELKPDGATRFECLILFPGTDYKRYSSITYYPGGAARTVANVQYFGDQSPSGSQSISTYLGMIFLNVALVFGGTNRLLLGQF